MMAVFLSWAANVIAGITGLALIVSELLVLRDIVDMLKTGFSARRITDGRIIEEADDGESD